MSSPIRNLSAPDIRPGARLRRMFLLSVLAYCFFLIPTLALLPYLGFKNADTLFSQLIPGAWSASFWTLFGTNGKPAAILLDVFSSIIIALVSWLFYLGYTMLSRLSTRGAAESKSRGRAVIIWTALCGLILLPVIPFHSSDLYGYLNRGFQQSVLNTNPYLVTIAQIPGWWDNPLFQDHWIYNPCPYGFFFAQLAAGLTQLVGPHFTPALLLFKSLNWLLLVATTILIARLARHFGSSRPWLSAFLFGANPLVLLHVMGNGHNDILMVFLLLAALSTLTSRTWAWACLPLFTLSVLTKYASILALPFIVIYMIRQQLVAPMLWGGLQSVALLILLARPYLPPPDMSWPWKAMLDNAGKPQHSLIAMLGHVFYYLARPFGKASAEALMSGSLKLLKPVFWLGFIALYARECFRFFRQPVDYQRLFRSSGLVITAMVVYISAKFNPWYVVMFLPLLLVLPEGGRLRRLGLYIAAFQIAAFTFLQNVHIIGPLLLIVLPTWLALRRQSA